MEVVVTPIKAVLAPLGGVHLFHVVVPAFDADIQVGPRVSDPDVGDQRIQFLRAAIDKAGGNIRAFPKRLIEHAGQLKRRVYFERPNGAGRDARIHVGVEFTA